MRHGAIHFYAVALCLTGLAFAATATDPTSTATVRPGSPVHKAGHATSHTTGHATTKQAVKHSTPHANSTKDSAVPTSYATATPAHTTAQTTHKPGSKSKSRVAVKWVSPAVRQAALTEVTDRMVVRGSHFENAAALVPFFELMNSAQRSGQAVHILQFGDSHTASDDWANSMRIAFQAKYGSGGPGFTHAGHPFRGYRRFDISGSNSTGWVTEGTMAQMGDGRDGLSGISITAHIPGQTVSLTTSCDRLQLFYLQQPDGGSMELTVDGKQVGLIDTNGELASGVYEYTPEPGTHEYLLRTTARAPVRLFGWASDANRGVTVETLGINGAQASVMLNWDETLWSAQVAERDPALIILAYGTNEANNPKFWWEEYRAELRSVLARVRKAAPVASILMIGPPDCGRLRPLPHLDEVVRVQREVAQEVGAAFWDWRQSMGGPGATDLWVKAGLGQADHVHLTSDGYKLLGQALFEELELENSHYRSAQQAASFQTPL
ncbi:MAG: SGNH/GDSL hydrolase family protein [Bryobacteraceae bacterium]